MDERSPQISTSQSDILSGDEPVISGINSSILVRRRDAYYAGNLHTLVKMMSDVQENAFKRRNIRLALRTVSGEIQLYRRVTLGDRRLNTVCKSVGEWLDIPSNDQYMQVLHAFRDVGEAAFRIEERVYRRPNSARLESALRVCWAGLELANMVTESTYATANATSNIVFSVWTASRIAERKHDLGEDEVNAIYTRARAVTERWQLRTAYILLSREH